MRKDTSSTLLVLFSSAAILMLLASPVLLLLSNFILQPVQAQTTPMTFKTPSPAKGKSNSITFDAQGTNSSGDQTMNGTFQITGQDGTILDSGDIGHGQYSIDSNGVSTLVLHGSGSVDPFSYLIQTRCSTADTNIITVNEDSSYRGAVECSTKDTTDATHHQQSSPSHSSSSPMTATTTTTTQDSDGDGDGIPDSSDRCAHNSNTKCFKEAT